MAISCSAALGAGAAFAAPVVGVSPTTMPHVVIEQGRATTRTLTIRNDGDAALTFDLRVGSGVTSEPGDEVIALQDPTLNETDPTQDQSLAPEAVYSGDHLSFGLSTYGEVMPYQYPIGTEHLQVGSYRSGYTVAWKNGTLDRIAYASYAARTGLTPVSYEEIENSASRVLVRVVTQTFDGALQITREFEFMKSRKHIDIETTVENVSPSTVSDVVFKSFADWDIDGSYNADTFDSDEDANLLYAYESHYCGTASDRVPDYIDLDGWNDYTRRVTDEELTAGPVTFDGAVVLHFELGALAPGASDQVGTVFASGDTLEELKGEIGFARWLSADVTSGVVAPGASQDVVMTYDALDLDAGGYAAQIAVVTNDPVTPEVVVPATMWVLPDATPPAPVDDLVVSGATPDSLALEWTAVADNGLVGKPASTYDVRYSTAPITEANWALATPVDGEPPPASPGELDGFVVTGLGSETLYYLALKTADDVGRVSALSNVASAYTAEPAHLVVDPTSLSDTLMEGRTATHEITLTNTGGYPLSYSTTVAETAAPARVVSGATSRSIGSGAGGGVVSIDDGEYVPGEIIVRFVPGHAASKRASARGGAKMKRRISKLDMEVWELPSKGRASMLENLNVLAKNPNVLYAQPNWVVEAIEAPSDPRFDELWGLHNTGQTGGVDDADIDALEAWDQTVGSASVVVAVIDTGIDYTHPDLVDNVWVNPGEIPANGIDDDSNGYVDDVYGYDFANDDSNPMDGHSHGTHCAGTIGAAGGNGIGVVGVSHEVTLMAVKFLSDSGFGNTADAIDSVIYAVDNGADILSNSWGGGGYSAALEDAIVYALDRDVLFVAAAGNDAVDNDFFPHYPSSYDVDNVVSVAATDDRDLKAGFSNWGVNTVDLGAPGVDTLSTVPSGYGYKSGTSMATPHVAGAAALLKAFNPSLSALDIKAALMESVDLVASMSGRTVTGGRLNVANALSLAGPDWIRLGGDDAGEIPPGFSRALLVEFDTTGKLAGDYAADVTIDSSDPDSPVTVVPVDLTVLPDCCPPAAVDDLAAADVGTSGAALSWTAVGDDGLIGRASGYDVRYSTLPLTETSWDAATEALGEGAPLDPGSAESFDLAGLVPATDYWIGIKTRDDSGQLSELSNVVAIRTLDTARIVVSPATMPHVTLQPGATTQHVLSIANEGEVDLVFDLRIDLSPDAEPGGEIVILPQDPTANDTDPTQDQSLNPEAVYSGDHLSFGLSTYGEVMPYQYPIGTEHLQVGSYLSGYTVVWNTAGLERVASASYALRSGVLPVSYEELENSASRVLVRVVTQTFDRALQITRVFDFTKDRKHIEIETTVENVSGATVSDVVFKSFADWDIDGSYNADTFDSDDDTNLLYAYEDHYGGIASDRIPDYRDLDGWNDFTRRLTDEELTTGPALFDGAVLLHFELGSLAPGGSDQVGTVYASGDTLEELKSEIGFARWLSADMTSGVVAPGTARDIVLTYDATDAEVGEYAASIVITSNDPAISRVDVPATLSVALNAPPIVDAGGPYETDEGTSVLFDASGSSDPDGDALQYRWDHDGDGTWDTPWSSSATSTHTWDDDRVGIARVEVTDGHFIVEGSTSVTVQNVPPTALDVVVATDEDAGAGVILLATDPGADVLALTVVGLPSNGVLSGVPPSLIYTPNPDYHGFDSFTYVAHDGAASSLPATVSITVSSINDPPACADDEPATEEDVALDVGVIGNDTGGPPNEDQTLTILELGSAAHGVVEANGDGSVHYTPDPDYFGSDVFSYTVRDSEGLTDSCSVLVAIAPVNDPPIASADPPAQSVQYSDHIAPVTITSSDVDSASLTPGAGLPEGLSLGDAACTPVGLGVECTWELTGRALLAAGEHDVAVAIGDGGAQGSAVFGLSVDPEDAFVTFNEGNDVAVEVADPGGASGEFVLVVDVAETFPEAASAAAPDAGDIGTTGVSAVLEPIGPGAIHYGDCSTSDVSGVGYGAVNRVTCVFDGVSVNTYAVNVAVEGGYYAGDGEDVVTVFDPSLGFVTGGGWFYWPGSSDAEAGYAGHRTNFGISTKYNGGSDEPKGNILMISHVPGEKNRRVKSTDLHGLSVGGVDEVDGSFAWATIAGAGSYSEEEDVEAVGVTESHEFVVYIEEHGTEHAENDRIWIQVDGATSPTPLWMELPAASYAVEIEGGNIVVPHSSTDHDGDGLASIDDNCPGIPNPDQLDTDDDARGDVCDDDDDGDGLTDVFELANGFDPLVPGEDGLDSDGDGLDNITEQWAGTDPHSIDGDGDGFSDAEELAANSDPNDPTSVPLVAVVPALSIWGLAALMVSIMLATSVALAPVRPKRF